MTGRVWDFGGQVVLHSMHEFFLTARSLYLLVLGERDDMLERDVAYWLQLIRSYAGDAPVVVALNKSAGRQRQLDRESLGEELRSHPRLDLDRVLGRRTTPRPESRPCADAHGRDRQPAHGQRAAEVPEEMAGHQGRLEGMKESYLDYEALRRDGAQRLGEPDPEEQMALAADLHDLGVALNYGRDPRLRDTTVLRPGLAGQRHLRRAAGQRPRREARRRFERATGARRRHHRRHRWRASTKRHRPGGCCAKADYPPDKR